MAEKEKQPGVVCLYVNSGEVTGFLPHHTLASGPHCTLATHPGQGRQTTSSSSLEAVAPYLALQAKLPSFSITGVK